MLTAGRTELLLDTEGISNVAVIFLECFDVDGYLDILTDFVVFVWCVLIDKVTASAQIL